MAAKTGKRKQIVKIIVLSLLLIVVLALAVTPTFVKNYINNNGIELSGRTINIQKIKYNYFTSTLRVYDAKMYEHNNSEVFVGFDSLLINIKPLRLLKKEVHVQQFKVVHPYSQIIQNDTLFNFTDLIEFFNTGEDLSEYTTETMPYRLNLNLIEIKNGRINYIDGLLDHTIGMDNISFSIPHIYWGGEESSADVAFNIGHGGSISSSFDFDSKTGDYSGEAKLNQLAINVILPYIQEYMSLGGIDGTLDASVYYSGNQYDLNSLTLSGNALVNNLIMTDQQDKKVLGVKKAEAVLKTSKPMLYEAEIGRIWLNRPYMYFALIDSLSNLEKMLIYEDDTALSETSENEDLPPYNIFIENFVVDSGLIDFSDQRMKEQFDYELSEVHVDMDSLSLNSNWVEINSSMKLNKRGNLEAQIGVNPYAPFQHIELNYVLSDFQLPDVNIYSKHYMGLPILFGDMYYRNKTIILDKHLNSENKLVIRNVEMGRKAGGLYNIPIKLALFILKDINGDVVLDIPVSGDLSDPKTHIGQIVWNTFKGFTFKIVASPFKALGNLLGADPKELEEITLVYSDTTLTGKQRRGLDLLLELEQMKPELQIEMQYLNDRKLERVDAAAQIVQSVYEQKTKNNPLTHQKDYLDYLKTESGRDSLVMQDYERFLAPAVQVDSLIYTREKHRINLVKDYLHQQNDSTSIRIVGYNTNEVLNIGSRPQFSISYKLAEDEEL
ncbi:DUF748 domain-containing protein [Prolixibacteraceae bacterium Z1-6]|uniref:DUF748 domain-containing protein n=1 Tax=Draconibacterium aestuarii TaxID=2998507 RepID=A0A9X3J9F0_9BACT|nr:DUF748 domain-containing protein [Prolixibacteraceae bacterium Z1-6]